MCARRELLRVALAARSGAAGRVPVRGHAAGQPAVRPARCGPRVACARTRRRRSRHLASRRGSTPQRTGLDTPVGARGDLLSAGERQLVSIARAYLRDPDVLILDEATSAVDPATEVRISRALERLMKGRTSVVIAHRLSTAERADFVAVMDHGELVEFGSHARTGGGRRAATRACTAHGWPKHETDSRRAARRGRIGAMSLDPGIAAATQAQRCRTLVCAVVQDATTRRVLMVAWMNDDALDETLRTRRGVYFSRSRNEMWRKGETSGSRPARGECGAGLRRGCRAAAGRPDRGRVPHRQELVL